MRFLLTAGCLALLVSLISIAQLNTPTKENSASAARISGKQLYQERCAVCHGMDGKGGGPYAASLKVWPPDLTSLAAKNNGRYPELHIAEVIDGEFEQPAHGNREMPIWGPVFRKQASGKRDSAQVRIKALVHYLESIQAK